MLAMTLLLANATVLAYDNGAEIIEEIITMLHRFVQNIELNDSIDQYSDSESVSEWVVGHKNEQILPEVLKVKRIQQ